MKIRWWNTINENMLMLEDYFLSALVYFTVIVSRYTNTVFDNLLRLEIDLIQAQSWTKHCGVKMLWKFTYQLSVRELTGVFILNLVIYGLIVLRTREEEDPVSEWRKYVVVISSWNEVVVRRANKSQFIMLYSTTAHEESGLYKQLFIFMYLFIRFVLLVIFSRKGVETFLPWITVWKVILKFSENESFSLDV